MSRLFLAGVLAGLTTLGAASSVAHASGPRPAITIVSPSNGTVVHGTSLSVRFAVRNFTLVSPTLKNPPPLKGSRGHIQVRLDTLPFDAKTDATASLRHTWTHLPKGRHVLTAYLANNQFLRIPGVAPARLSFTIAAKRPPVHRHTGGHHAGGGPVKKPHPTSPGISQGPTTGGAVIAGTPPSAMGAGHSPLNLSLLLAAILALLTGGSLVLGSRLQLAFGGGSGGRGNEELSVMPAGPGEIQAAGSVEAWRVTPSEPPPETEEASADALPAAVRSEEMLPAPVDEHPAPTEAVQRVQAPDEAVSRSEDVPATGSEPWGKHAIEMAREWPDLVESLVRRLDEAEAERSALRERVAGLERAAADGRALRQAMSATSQQDVTAEDLEAVQYVTDSLIREPEHIVVLASVAQHATRLHAIVAEYARIRRALQNQGE